MWYNDMIPKTGRSDEMKIDDAMIKGLCSDMVYKRGCEYFTAGRVHIKKRSETQLSAAVDGEEIYNVFITFENDRIKNELCTCQYYETLQSPCKHIVAVLKHRQAEQEAGSEITNENDRIAENLCSEFAQSSQRERVRAQFELFIKPNREGDAEYEMSLSLPDLGGRVEGLENFLDCYLTYRDYKMDRSNIYSRRRMYFKEHEDAIIKIMAEVYQTRSSGVDLYRKLSTRTSFGSAVVRRILPHLMDMDFKLVYDGLVINGARILKEDPDILIDIEAFGRDVVMSLSESGFAITPNGEWFFYNDVIYNTTPMWRDYFMPIYRSLSQCNRTQITFRGDNSMLFAAHVLPKLRKRHGVVISGVDEIVVDTTPEFCTILDYDGTSVTAVPMVNYGTMQFKLCDDNEVSENKIILRDREAEELYLAQFSEFTKMNTALYLSDTDAIYRFIVRTMKSLSAMGRVIMSDRFKNIEIRDDVPIDVTARYNEKTDYLEINFESELTPQEIDAILRAITQKDEYYRTDDGAYITLTENKKNDVLELLKTVGVTETDLIRGSKEISKVELLRIEATAGVKKDKSINDYLAAVRSVKPKLPRDLNGTLREYQKDGIAWLTQLSELGMGGILADDMGLGKTLQTIAYIHGIKPKKPALIVAPATLVYNWQNELERFTPNAKYLVISGSREVRDGLLKTINDYEFVITSYPLLRRDIAKYQNIEFSYCVIDEAQYIKNRKTMNAVSVKRINAEHKFALTGTPVENSIMELWSIFDFIMPGYLKTARKFSEEYAGIGDNNELAAALRNIIRPFVLRRMKRDVLDELPEKIETTMLSELSREQKALYKKYADEARVIAQGMAGGRDKMTILTYLLRLRQICAHPDLFTEGSDGRSGKLEQLLELINDARSGEHRVLVFSQFKTMLDIIADELKKAEIDYFVIDGTVPQEERVEVCERFNNGEGDVVLVSLKAGGTGINLTGADTVIHYDPWWNPAVTDQATDRAYRIGQTRAVQVIKLASQGTIEEKILKLQNEKRRLADDIIKTNTKTLTNLTDDELLSLFDL